MFLVSLYTIISVIVVSLISLAGAATLLLGNDRLEKITTFLVAISAGALLGDTFIHLLPEAAKTGGFGLWISVIGGMVLFFILEKFVHWRHCHIPTSDAHPHHLGTMNLVGDGLHNFIDGAVVAGAFLVSIPLGWATALAVILHEIPQEISEVGVLIHAGYSKRGALIWNLISASAALAGAILILLIGARDIDVASFLIPFTAGGFIYIATADLIPELHKETVPKKSLIQLASILLGLAIMVVLKVVME